MHHSHHAGHQTPPTGASIFESPLSVTESFSYSIFIQHPLHPPPRLLPSPLLTPPPPHSLHASPSLSELRMSPSSNPVYGHLLGPLQLCNRRPCDCLSLLLQLPPILCALP